MPLPQVTDDDNCITWNKHCNSECCRLYVITATSSEKYAQGTTIEIKKTITKDLQWYYKLHGAKYIHGTLRVHLNNHTQIDNKLYVYRDCDALTKEGKCKYHGTPQQPKICSNPDTKKPVNQQQSNVVVTPNCLCNFR